LADLSSKTSVTHARDAGWFERSLGLALAAVALAGPAVAQEASSVPERVSQLHAQAIVVDGHNDLPWRIRSEADLDIARLGLGSLNSSGHTDMVRLRAGGVDAQFWAAYVPARFMGAGAAVVALEQIDLIHRLVAAFPEQLELAYSVDDIIRISETGRTASLIGIEGGHAIANSLPTLRMFYDLGVRYMTLTHSATLPWADAADDSAEVGGLSDFGREVVREMNRLGMLVDLSHVTPEAMRDAIEASAAPIIFSHSSARAVRDVERNVPDEVLAMMPGNGGVVMINFYSDFLVPEEQDGNGTVATIADHIDHVVSVAGIDYVGLGSDFDGVDALPAGMDDVSMLPNITAELVRRGYSDEDVLKVLGGNLLRAMRQAEAVAVELRASRSPGLDRLPYFGREDEADE
jgi:membrane dipeptidase